MKILCVCNNGNVRSTTLARLLKGRGHQVLVLGAKDFCDSDDVDIDIALQMCVWSDIIFCQKDSEKYLLKIMERSEFITLSSLTAKIDLRFDVGYDDWKVPMHPHLLAKMRDLLEEEGFG